MADAEALAPKEAEEVEESKWPVPERCWERAKKLQKNTGFSKQESELAAMMIYGYNKEDVIEELDITSSHYDMIAYERLPSKVEKSRNVLKRNLVRSPLGSHLQKTMADSEKKSVIGCSGPNCDEDINTHTDNPEFKNHYSKIINEHPDKRKMSNHSELYFCSLSCLAEHDKKL